MSSFEEALGRLLERIEVLGAVTDTPGALTRTFLSPANRAAARLVGEWMEGAGMEVSWDRGGTVRGCLAARGVPSDQWAVISERQLEGEERGAGGSPSLGDGRPLVLGSHIDTVIDAGKYDGALGVLMAIAALEVTGPLDFPVHVLGFSEEEGVRFHATYLGSRACVGRLDAELLALRDFEGISLAEALEHGFGNVPHNPLTPIDPAATLLKVEEFLYRPGEARGYVEVHIEQGRCLEELNEPVCAVSGISGQSRLVVTVTGQADHAGTTPMELRRDALAGAAECILATEQLARAHPGLLATVGKIEARPGASNVIPGEVRFSLDFRHPDDAARERLLVELLGCFEAIGRTRGLAVASEVVQENAAVPCDPALTQRLIDVVEPITKVRRSLPSGAGHDAVMMATVMPVGMLFVRCRAGLSHHPDEYASAEDIGVAFGVMVEFLRSAE